MRRRLYLTALILIAVFSFTNLFAQYNDWYWKHPQPQGNYLRYVKMFSATNWVALGYYGTFIRTTNAGTSWYVSHAAGGPYLLTTKSSLYSGWFFNMNTGLACGSSGTITRTTNSGVTWDTIPSGVTGTLYGMHFVNSSTGFIAGSSSSLLKTTNAGMTWTTMTAPYSTLYNIYALDENNIFVVQSSGGIVQITTNGGTNWTARSIGVSTTLYDVNFGDVNTGFVCGSSGNVRVTVNSGVNWTSINAPGTATKYDLTTFPIVVPPTNLLSENFEATTYPPTGWTETGTLTIWDRSTAASGYGVGLASSRAYFYGVSSGTGELNTSTFTPTTTGDSLKFDHAYATYINENDQLQISTSTNGGTSWTVLITLNGGVSGPLVTAPPTTSNFVPTAAQWATKRFALPVGTNRLRFSGITAYGNNLYIDNIFVTKPASTSYEVYVTGDPYYIFHSSDLGANWDSLSHSAANPVYTSTYYCMDRNTSSNFLAGGAFGLLNSSTNSGSNWAAHTQFIYSSTLNDIWAENMNGKVWAVGSSAPTPIMYSSDGGNSWTTDQGTGITNALYGISMLNSSTGFVCGSSGSMFKTTNGGTNWNSLTTGVTSTLYMVEFLDANTGYVSGSSGTVRKSTDGGATWTAQTSGVTSTLYWIDMVDANTGWFVGSSAALRKTTDGGATWTAQTPNYTSTLYEISMINASTGYLCGASGTVRRTTNGGTDWDTVSNPYNSTLYSIHFLDINTGFISGLSGFTARTSDGGSNWEILDNGALTQNRVFMKHPDSAWVAASSGSILKFQRGVTAQITWNSEIPERYSLSQNYPNPFNPSTTIKFGIPKAGKVSLKIYDITGRIVAEPFNNFPLNAGNVTYIFDGKNLASGVYFYSLIVDDRKINTKKMVLVK